MAVRTVWKQALGVTQQQEVRLPCDAMFVAFGAQHGVPCIWYQCSPDAELKPIRFYIVFTGNAIPDEARRYLGTCQLDDGDFVLHLYTE